MALNLFICQTPFHILASEAVLHHYSRHVQSEEVEPVKNHLVYYGRGKVSQLDRTLWDETSLFNRPREKKNASGLAGTIDSLRTWFLDFRYLVAAERKARHLIDGSHGAVNLHVAHFEGAIANDLANRYSDSPRVSLLGFPDGLLDVFPLERVRIQSKDILKAAAFRALGIKFWPQLGPIGGAQHPLFDHYFTFFPQNPSEIASGERSTQISLEFLIDNQSPVTKVPHVLILGQEPVIAAWGEAAYLTWVERSVAYLRDRYPAASLIYKPHHSGPYVHLRHDLGIPVLADDLPMERQLGSYNVAVVASLASTGLVTAKLMLGDAVDAISVDSRPGVMSSNKAFRRHPEALTEAFHRLGVEEVRLS